MISSTRPLAAGFPTLNGGRLSTLSSGGIDDVTGSLNGFYDLPRGGAITPYLGAGVGFDSASEDQANFITSNGSARSTERAASNTGLMLVAEGGLSIALSPRWSIVPAYRYQHRFVSGAPDAAEHIFKIGLRYGF